jgi:cell division septation protein DedD
MTAATNSDHPEFVLKHRITGAAFLLFFGALVLPWVLGAPGAAKIADEPQATPNSVAAPQEKVVNENILNDIVGEEEAMLEQVYISKITPLAIGAGEPPANNSESEPATAAGSDAVSVPVTSAKPLELKQKKPAARSSNEQSATAQVKSGTATNSASTPASTSTPAPTSSSASAPSNPMPLVDQTPAQIEVGWIVQVGVFTDERGAARVVDDLQDKGFNPSTTIVDTNRGKATGTRIWLGPFAQRVDAAKAKSSLTDKTGEAGFIRAYP